MQIQSRSFPLKYWLLFSVFFRDITRKEGTKYIGYLYCWISNITKKSRSVFFLLSVRELALCAGLTCKMCHAASGLHQAYTRSADGSWRRAERLSAMQKRLGAITWKGKHVKAWRSGHLQSISQLQSLTSLDLANFLYIGYIKISYYNITGFCLNWRAKDAAVKLADLDS